jgi:ankyrin repeat protein
VIAHRGTETINPVDFFKDFCTDIKGIVCNKYVDQMSSASTFANKVVTVMQEIEKENKVIFELFFTGHSLGGWLAQITTFTTEYLHVRDSREVQEGWLAYLTAFITKPFKVKSGAFLKKLKTDEEEPPASNSVQDSHDITYSYHPHTVVFDSPGCKDMLLKMADRLDVRHEGHSIHLQHLDITSYLSAPNLINTCNTHLGTVYRIFTDLSHMGVFGENTPLYNLATHCMDKIVQSFDLETGQVRKDDECRLKIQEVIDWPVRAGKLYGQELNEFFTWAKRLNNYHPEVKEISCRTVVKGYHPLRYQTKAHDERTKSLSIFNKDQLEFLECYLCLLKLKKPLQYMDSFSVMNNSEAEKEVEQNLQNIELVDNERIRCPDIITLHALVPYLKRLVRLFPHIKKKIKDKLSLSEIINKVCQKETQHYVKQIHRNALDFNDGALGLKEFLDSDQQIGQLQMVDGNAWRGITQIYWVLQNTSSTPNYNSEGHYTIVQLKWLLTVNRVINLNALLTSMETPHLLMIACETNQAVNGELENIFKELFSILKQKDELKIILTMQSKGDIAAFIQQIASNTLSEGVIETDEQLTWSDLTALTWNDLTASLKTKLLEKAVKFQGRRVALNHVTSSSVTDSFPLTDLLHEEKITIGEEPALSTCCGYNGKYYVDRTFNHNIVIRQDISSDERQGKFADLVASTEQEFRQLCQQNPTSNVHWLENDKSGELIWQQSQGNLKTLRKYVDGQKFKSYAPRDLDNLLQQAKHKRVMLIADKAGMGKSTVLTHLSKRILELFPDHWFVRINLNSYTDLWEVQKERKMERGDVLEFLSKEVLNLKSYLEEELFKKNFEGNEVNKVVVMVDGFDEICPGYKKTVIDMLQILKQTSVAQLWVTTRPHLKEELEDNLQQLSYTLQPFSEVEQVELLRKLWLQTSNIKTMDQDRLKIYAVTLIRHLAQSVKDKDKEFTGIPLQIDMLAKAFEEDFTSFYLSQKSEPELLHKLDLLVLYRRFTDGKYNIYCKEKYKTPAASNMAVKEQQKRYFECIESEHQVLALKALFTEDQVALLQIDDDSPFSDEELARIGIAQRNNEGKLHFIHCTFAEYYVAQFVIKRLNKKTKPHPQMQEFLVSKVLLQTDCQVIRSFLDGFLEKSEPSNEALEVYGEKLNDQLKKREHGTLEGATTALHTAATEDNASIIGFLLESLKSGKDLSTVTKMLLATDHQGRTALHKAAENDSVQALKKIWEWAEEVTTWKTVAKRDHLVALSDHSEASDKTHALAEEEELQQDQIKNKLFVAKDKCGNTAWHAAAERGSVKVLEALWTWAKKAKLNTHELLLAQNKEGNTAWQLAAQTGHLKLLQKLGAWAKEVEVNPNELKNKLLLAKDNYGCTVWYRAAESGNLEALETLWFLGKDSELKPDEMLLAQNKEGITAWKVATQRCHFKVLKKLCEWAKGEQKDKDVLWDNLLLAKDQYGNTAWHRAAERGNLETLEALWSWAKEVEIDTNKLKEVLFLVEDERGETPWHLAADGDHLAVLEKMWVWAKEKQWDSNDLMKEFLVKKNKYGYTVWHRATQRGRLKALKELWV